ncbi:DinB family protein [Christiangramia aquimixticola]|uniref:DinB family protein n=1 Tax=Christiangramia aquimixticola TaxID=1697558 RepID=UPI003AA7D575
MKKSELVKGEIGDFYWGYIDKIPADAELVSTLKKNTAEFVEFLKTIPKEKWTYRYAAGKWDILEMVQHIIDTERIFQYRALSFARNENGALPGFDHDTYVLNSGAENRTPVDLIHEFEIVRESAILLFKSMTNSMLTNTGNMNDMKASARAIGFIMPGHVLHHISILNQFYL